jgi:toxin FitB
MNLVDSCGWLEYFANGKNADFFSEPLQDTDNLIVPTICIYEVFKKILQEKNEDIAIKTIASMYQPKIISLDTLIALSAAKISLQLKLPFADSVILATAEEYNAKVWTQDIHFEKIKGVKYIQPKKK